MTQSNSRQRVKVDTIGNNGLEEMYQAYEKETKNTFINVLMRATSKDFMVTKVTNYVLAGLGLRV